MSQKKNIIDQNNLPEHISIIMDGNGRWAKKQGNKRIFGHQNAVTAVKQTVEACAELKIKFLSLYAFSTENWKRPKAEVNALMKLLVETIQKEIDTFMKNNVRLLMIGDMDRLPDDVQSKLKHAISKTAKNTGLSLVLALSYSSRWEITNAIKKIAKDIEQKKISSNQIDSNLFENYLCNKEIPDPSLLIRTSGEFRISNFLLWQIAYSELYFTDILWPDFRKEDLYDAIIEYQKRERRFGQTSEQITK